MSTSKRPNRFQSRAKESASTTGLQAVAAVPAAGNPTELPLDVIRPAENQPRQQFDEQALQELSASIQARGVLQPIRVRRNGSHYEIISGERRYRAAQMVGLTSIPVVLETREDYTPFDQSIDALTENLQRDNLNVVEEVEGIYQLVRMRASAELGEEQAAGLDYRTVEQALTRMRNSGDDSFAGLESIIEQITNELGLSWKTIAIKKSSVWRWPPEIVQALREQAISLEVARVLQGIPDEDARAYWLQRTISEGLSASTLRTLIKAATQKDEPSIHKRVTVLRKRIKSILDQVEALEPERVSARVLTRVERMEKAVEDLESLLA